MNIPILKWVVDLFIKSLLDLFTQHVDIGFIYVFAFLYQGDGVVDVDVGELGLFLLPVFI